MPPGQQAAGRARGKPRLPAAGGGLGPRPATEGARALIAAAFTEFGAQRVWAQTMAANTASRRVMEMAGLIHVVTFYPTFADPIDGTDLGEVEHELRRPDWRPVQTSATGPAPAAG